MNAGGGGAGAGGFIQIHVFLHQVVCIIICNRSYILQYTMVLVVVELGLTGSYKDHDGGNTTVCTDWIYKLKVVVVEVVEQITDQSMVTNTKWTHGGGSGGGGGTNWWYWWNRWNLW